MSIHSWDVLETYRDNLFTGTWPSIPQMFLITLEEHSERNAFTIIENSNKKTLTYKQVYQKVLDVAFYLKENEIKKGDRIILNGKNSPNWAIAYLGILFAGATVVPLDNQLHIERVENLTAFSQVKAIFADSDVLNKFSKKNQI